MSGFTRESRLKPCITLVLYYGSDWDGARDLYGILDFEGIPAELRDKVNNYKIYVCEVRKFENTEVFQTDLKQVFDCIRYSEDMEKLCELTRNDPAYQELDEEAYEMIAGHIKTQGLMEVKHYRTEGEKINMSEVVVDFVEWGRLKGIEQGSKALVETSKEFGSTRGETTDRLVNKLNISRETAEEYVERYWC